MAGQEVLRVGRSGIARGGAPVGTGAGESPVRTSARL